MRKQSTNPLRKVNQQRFPSDSRKTRTVRVPFDEYVAEVNGSVAFNTTTYSINPGLAASFPWLSQQAGSWERYQFESLEAYYIPIVSQYATNGQSGKVILNLDYDATDSPPTSKREAMDSAPAESAMPYEGVALKARPSELRGSVPHHYVRARNLAPSEDRRFYDAALLNVSTEGNQDGSAIGELHFRGVVTFNVQVLEADGGSGPVACNCVSQFNLSANQAIGGAVVATIGFDEIITDGLTVGNVGGVFTPPEGNYIVTIQLGSDNATGAMGATSLEVNDLPLAIPCTSIGGYETAMIRFLPLSGTDTVRVRVAGTGLGTTIKGDACRILFEAV